MLYALRKDQAEPITRDVDIVSLRTLQKHGSQKSRETCKMQNYVQCGPGSKVSHISSNTLLGTERVTVSTCTWNLYFLVLLENEARAFTSSQWATPSALSFTFYLNRVSLSCQNWTWTWNPHATTPLNFKSLRVLHKRSRKGTDRLPDGPSIHLLGLS